MILVEPPVPVEMQPPIDSHSPAARTEILRVVRDRFPIRDAWPEVCVDVIRNITFAERCRFANDDGGMDFDLIFWAIQEVESTDPVQANKDYMEGDTDKPIDELDKANFSNGKSSVSGSKVEGTCVCAANFHPMLLNDEVHEQFIEEVESKTPHAHVEGSHEAAEMLPNQEDMDIYSHMEYCSAQLKKIEMGDSEGDDDINLPEMVCLRESIAEKIGSAKRSLIESLEMAEMEKRGKRIQFRVRNGGLCSLPNLLQDNMAMLKSWRKLLHI
ncbi:hypothetical protein D1007_14239 [Hordeum vulgare]|nr:hypothetical protein D1007_14239 [Hordeum vulgare]